MNIADGIFLCRRRSEKFLHGIEEHGDFLVVFLDLASQFTVGGEQLAEPYEGPHDRDGGSGEAVGSADGRVFFKPEGARGFQGLRQDHEAPRRKGTA
jgi:hypothetical protein